jgi:hypothetical protein
VRSAVSFVVLSAFFVLLLPTTAAGSYSAGIAAGINHADYRHSPGNHLTVHANGFLRPISWIELGGELGYHSLGSTGTSATTRERYNLFQATPQVRLRPRLHGLRPYLSGGLGLYSVRLHSQIVFTDSPRQTKFGLNGGLGLTLGRSVPYGVDFGIRWHDLAGSPDFDNQSVFASHRMRFYTATLGLAFN